MVINLDEVITDYSILSQGYIMRDGFVFTSITCTANVYDAIVIKCPNDVVCFSPRIVSSKKTLEEHIEFINKYKISKALVIANNLDFISQCPSLKVLSIIPGDSAGDNFDYSPLYKMQNIKSLFCLTIYGSKEEFSTTIDYSKIRGIEDIVISSSRELNYKNIETIKTLSVSNYKGENVEGLIKSKKLDTLAIASSKIKNLKGIDYYEKLQCLYLFYNRSLNDISEILHVKNTLKVLRLEGNSKIEDFKFLEKLENLEVLELTGNNVIPNLEFLKKMKNMKTFVFDMNVEDGNLNECLKIDYVKCRKNYKHYNLKDKDLPKNKYYHGNENIDEWRRLY